MGDPSVGRSRPSILGLMVVVAVIGVEIAAVRAGDPASVDLSGAVNLAVLVAATFRARHRGGRGSAFWFGFALAGWASFLFVMDGFGAGRTGSIARAWPAWLLQTWYDWDLPGDGVFLGGDGLDRFYRILDNLIILPLGLVGGLVCRRLAGRPSRPGPSPGSP